MQYEPPAPSGPRHRLQFLLSPVATEIPDGWDVVSVGSRTLAHHPHLDVAVASGRAGVASVIGYCFDPLRPDVSERELAAELAGLPHDESAIAEFCQKLSGRWVAIRDDGDTGVALCDAGGTRQVCHTSTSDGVWLASHPRLLADAADLVDDPDAVDHRSSGGTSNGRWWPGSSTVVTGVARLLPNHAVDLVSGSVRRVWPRGPIESLGLDEAAERIATHLRLSVLAVARRAPLTLMLSGGWESRLVLAACRELVDDMTFISLHTHQQGPEDSTIAAQLARRLDLDLTFDVTEPKATDAFWSDYQSNVDDALVEYASTAEVLLRRCGRERIVLTGHMPIVHTFFKKLSPSESRRFALDTTLRLARAGSSEFERRATEAWLSGVPRDTGVPPIDFFRWEQQWGGSWLTPWLLQYDWSWNDCFLPLSQYPVIEAALGVPARFRFKPSPELTHRVVAQLWPDVLDVEIDGGSRERETSLRRNVYVAAQRIKAEATYRRRQLRAR